MEGCAGAVLTGAENAGAALLAVEIALLTELRISLLKLAPGLLRVLSAAGAGVEATVVSVAGAGVGAAGLGVVAAGAGVVLV